ncbi:MAK10-like protein [Tanacetum coccineum]
MVAHSTDFASNWLERLPAGSITTWEDLTTHFLAQFFPPGRTAKLCNDILRRTIDQSAGGKLRDRNAKESWALLEDLALYDNESWNDPRDFAKPVKAIALPQDVPSTSDRRLIELENQVQRLMEAHLAPTQPTQVNKITTSCEICSGPHDTQYCMEDPEQAFVEYASSRTDEAGDARLTKFEADFKQQQSEMTNKIDTVLKVIIDRMTGALPSDTVKNPKLSTYPVLSARSYPTEDLQCSTHVYGSINTIVRKNEDSCKEEPEAGEQEVEYFDVLLTRSELAYHKYLMYRPIPSIFLRNPIITEGCPSNLKIPCNVGHVHVERAYIDLNSPLSIMTRMLYNWILRRKLDPWENSNRGISNFTGRIKGMHVFVGNFTYITDFMIVEDISSIIDHRLSQVVLGRPFIEISNMTHDPPEGVVRFTNGNDEVEYKMPHKIEQYNSLSNLEK